MSYIDYLYAGQILGGVSKIKYLPFDAEGYLGRLVDLYLVSQKINLANIEKDFLKSYGMTMESLVEDIQYIDELYESAIGSHKDEIIKIRLTR